MICYENVVDVHTTPKIQMPKNPKKKNLNRKGSHNLMLFCFIVFFFFLNGSYEIIFNY